MVEGRGTVPRVAVQLDCTRESTLFQHAKSFNVFALSREEPKKKIQTLVLFHKI